MCEEISVNPYLQALLTSIVTLIASSGFWAYVMHKDSAKAQTNNLLMGLAYDKIITMGMSYITRGWITQDEYEDYRRYLYEPYKKLGGNGVTERIVAQVANLPIHSRAKYAELLMEAKERGKDVDQHATNHAE